MFDLTTRTLKIKANALSFRRDFQCWGGEMKKFVLFVNDRGETFGNSSFVRLSLLREFPELGKWFEMAGGRRDLWTNDQVYRLLSEFSGEKTCMAIVVSEKVGLELVAETVKLGIGREIPVIIIGTKVVVQTMWKDPKGELILRDSLFGHPILDTPIERLKFKYPRTKNIIDRERRFGRVATARDLVDRGTRGILMIDGVGPTVLKDIVDTLEQQLEITVPEHPPKK